VKQRWRASEIDIYDFERVDQLLVGWQTHAARQRLVHEQAALTLSVFHYALGVPAAILAAFAGTAAVAELSEQSGPWGYVGAVLATVSAILTGLQTLLNFGARSEAHRQSAAAYKKLIRRLERVPPETTELAALPADSARYKEIERLERALGDVDSAAPLPPRRIARSVEHVEIHLKHEVGVVTAGEPTFG
jgi:hypothetical protein